MRKQNKKKTKKHTVVFTYVELNDKKAKFTARKIKSKKNMCHICIDISKRSNHTVFASESCRKKAFRD